MAADVAGRGSVATWYEVENGHLYQYVDHLSREHTYPIVADPVWFVPVLLFGGRIVIQRVVAATAAQASHKALSLPKHTAQRDRTLALIDARQDQFHARIGTPMPEDNIWLTGRRQELAALESIISRLENEDTTEPGGVAGHGTASRGAVPIQLVTDGAHAATLTRALEDRITP